MDAGITTGWLEAQGMNRREARAFSERLAAVRVAADPDNAAAQWSLISRSALSPIIPFEIHLALYDHIFASWDQSVSPRPAWTPSPEEAARTHIHAACTELGLDDYDALYRWSVTDRAAFWEAVVRWIGVRFKVPPARVADFSKGPESPRWLPGASMNAADSCFMASPGSDAVVYRREGGGLERVTVRELDRLSARFANAFTAAGLGRGDAVAIAMPMTLEAVVAYLGTVRAGGVVASIADSFAAHEIETRLRIADADTVVTQDVIQRTEKTLPMYQKVVDAGAARAIVVPAGDDLAVSLREADVAWDDFLSDDDEFESVPRDPADTCNVLFSSGTTGDPKAIPWSHSTTIKCAMDGHFHHDIHKREVVAWPTNIGWMMGPWLIFASLMNRAAMALYYGAPNTGGFCEFVQDAGVNMLGVVPSLVRAWRTRGLTDGLDWSAIRCYSSTGEASNREDMLWLMSRAGYKPVVEYCGGTEIGGGYVTQALVQPASPSTFSTPALGLELHVLDDDHQSVDHGELFIVPPSIGLSLTLLNRDHHEVYYRDTPRGPGGEVLRRHGDQMEWLPGGYMRCQGRADDTMNLGGIKVSSAEIERACNTVDGVLETAAIAFDPPSGGPSELIVYTVLEPGALLDPDALKGAFKKVIASELNPLFRVSDVCVIDALPRTASNKVMRRVLRDQYRQ